ncbi:poly-beta-1,6 N-acetyl-D-glucosamine export porin PgaA [Paraburkholderia sp.]|uniref:poly-beta-1,6 N-acetyl-D-glucosamine export porin PgaA n=1 Tax=Paraburkholderia sp. TaxID=1926495 RepID=UPI0025D53D13|nr:poly-beta-1,6 N-acetyl-D-glucosamine export porin PgaA [Paraburkholderia sp.]
MYISPRRRPLGACAPAAVLLLSAYAALESKDTIAREEDVAKPVIFVVAVVDQPADETPVSRPVVTSDIGATIYAVDTAQSAPEPVTRDAQTHSSAAPDSGSATQVAENSADTATATPPAIPVIPATPEVAQNTQPMTEPTTGPTPPNPPPDSSTTPGMPPVGAPGQTPPAQTAEQPNDTLRREVFGLATSGGAIRALDEAKARPDVFTPVDIAQIEELSIRQEVRGGRDKVRAMSSHDRFDALDSAIHSAHDFEARLPETPEYAEVRASLAGDMTVAYAARGRMKDAVAAFESIPPRSGISVEALAAVGEAYSYLQEPGKSEQVYRRAIEQETSSTTDEATRGFQYGTHTRPIDLREGLFYALTDQDKYTQARQVLEDIRTALPPADQVHPWDLANDDYMRYYRLYAQYQIYIGQTSAGMAGLDRLREQVPFSAEVRNAQADATLGASSTRRARDMYSATLTDHPENLEALAGLGRTSLMLDDYANARLINNAFNDTFPENGSVRSFKRDYAAYRAPVLSVEFNGEHGNSALADNSFSIDTTLYSPPIYDNWRVFAHNFFGHANTDIGNVSRTRTGVGGDFRKGPLSVTAEATRSIGPAARTGGNGSVAYTFNDYVSANVSVDSDVNTLPWKAYVQHIWGKNAQVAINLTDTDRRSAELSYSATRFSDSNFNQEISGSATQRVFTAANQFVNLSLNLNTSSNTRANTAYFAPARDYTAELVAMHQWAIWRAGEKSLVQRIYLSAGAYNERGFGTSAEGGVRLEHAWTFSHDIRLTYGIGGLSHAYDGARETSGIAYATLTVPF